MPRTCRECESEIPESSRQGYCPRCLLKLAEECTTDAALEPDSAADWSRQLPRTFGSYQLLELLGEGGMGVVFKAFQKNLNRTVALKMLRSGLLATKDELKRFHAEAQAVARLKHPNIVTVHEIGEHEGRMFFSMECIEGRSLAEIVGRTPLPPTRAAKFTMMIAEAVHYAHSHGVLHRDLKPANVLVDDKEQPHVTDFGLAKELASDMEITRSGAILGTPSYMSPEQAAGRRKLVGAASDVYSLGAILYDLLTGRPPFRADSPADTLRQVIEQEAAPLRLLNAKVPRDLETICLKCLVKDPARRYDSAQQLAEDLGRFLRGEPILARRAGRLERTYRLAKRHPTLAALAIAAGAMFVLLGKIALDSNADARDGVEAAGQLAKGLAYDFERIGAKVSEVACDPNLALALTRTQQIAKAMQFDRENNPLLQLLAQRLKHHGHQLKTNENWLLLSQKGEILANLTYGKAKQLEEKSSRNYFRGVSKLTNGYYVSEGYKSDSDSRYKVSVIAPILTNGVFIGALARMIAYKELASETARTRTVVVARMDPDITKGIYTYAVFWHPKLDEKSIVPIPDDNPLRRKLDLVMRSKGVKDYNYTDPADEGKWVVGLSRVPDTPLILVYQVRDRVAQALLTAGVLLTICLAAFAVWFFSRRRQAQIQATGG